MQNRFWKTLLILLIVSFACQPGLEKRRDNFFEKGEKYYEAGQYREARRQVKNALKIDPQFAEGHHLLGLCYLKDREWEKAFSYLSKAVELEPSLLGAHLALGKLFINTRNYEKAAEKADLVLAKDPHNGEAKLIKAEVLTHSGKSDQARRLVGEISLYKSEKMGFYTALADFFIRAHDPAKAERTLLQALERWPQAAPLHLKLAALYKSHKRYPEAMKHYRLLVDMNPANESFHLLLIRFYLDVGRSEKARELLRHLIERNQKVDQYRLLLAQVLWEEKDSDSAEAVLIEGIGQIKNPFRLHLALGDLYFKSKRNLNQAERQYERLVALDSKNPIGYFRLGQLHVRQKKYDAALREFDSALHLDPRLVDVVEHKAAVYLSQRKVVKALTFCRQQISKFPNDARLYELLGRVEMSQGRTEAAESNFMKAIDLAPNWLAPYYHIANLYIRQGKMSLGIRKFEEALEANPDSVRMAFILGFLHQQIGNIEKAETYYEDILKIQADFIPAANNLAFLCAEHFPTKERLDKALKLSETAAKSEAPEVLDTLGWVYYVRGDLDKAVAAISQSLEKLPDNPTVNYHMGMVYLKKGEDGRAREFFEKALAEGDFPEKAKAKEALGLVVGSIL